VRFLLDENLSPEVAVNLSNHGYDAVHVAAIGLSGHADDQILRTARELERILITQDRWFANLAANPLGTHAGVVFLRLNFPSVQVVTSVLLDLLPRLQSLEAGFLVVSNERRYRVRRPDTHAS
jgi:predicted nuclease of predicted toxin-antitoxin system